MFQHIFKSQACVMKETKTVFDAAVPCTDSGAGACALIWSSKFISIKMASSELKDVGRNRV
jgi:hypothetical protein